MNKKILYFLLFVAFSGFSTSLYAAGFFTVAPGVIQFDLPQPKSSSFTIINQSAEGVRLRIKPVYFPVESSSLSLGKSLLDTPEVDNISRNIVVSPKFMSLPPGKRRKVRVFLRGEFPEKPGDYRTHLLIQTLEDAKEKNSVTGKADEGSLSVSLSIKLETAVAVYARLGKPDSISLDVQCRQLSDGKQAALSIKNLSSYKYDGWMGIYSGNKENSKELLQYRLISIGNTVRELKFESITKSNVFIKWGQTKEMNDGVSQCMATK